MLTWSLVEPTPEQRRHCQLKELFVRSSERGLGVGKAIMTWVAQYTVDYGCRRIDWPVKATNARGIAFYEGLGARQVVERLSFRLSEPGLGKLARQGTDGRGDRFESAQEGA
ncbi:GNAT family N-acetyltransferase [Variovorax rhizosphaerae]|uniref:GNAT family N-acetyltransferase n=1 Tax=Variovorax rhizosphaerae TaxID=1836200 RepID=A0ABU8WP16_9BURK